MPIVDVLADLVPLLGRPPDARTAELLAPRVHGPRDDSPHGPVLYWTWKETGISLLFKDDVMDDIQLYGIPPPGYARFEGSLPGGLALDACRREVRAALGAPTKEGVPQPILCDAGEYFRDDTEPHVTGYSHYWDRYSTPGYELQFTYDWEGDPGTGHPVGKELYTGDADGLRATLVHVSRPGAVPWYPAALGD